MFEALGIERDRIVKFSDPIRVRDIMLPLPSFEERHFAHKQFGELCNSIGRYLIGFKPPLNEFKPAYLSKENLKAGVRQVINENEMCAILQNSGVEIIFPETMSFKDQINLWNVYSPIISFSASALHTSVFNKNAHLICLTYGDDVDLSYPLCDWVNGTRAQYACFDSGMLTELGPSPDLSLERSGFTSRVRINDPEAAARAILRLANLCRPASERIAQGTDRIFGMGNGTNLSIGKPTSQSSTIPGDRMACAGATSGTLTGRYQVHTQPQMYPWWEVDLGACANIREVVVYNRTDVCAERANRIVLSVSKNGKDYTEVFSREEDAPFGGLNGDPLVIAFSRPVQARFVRLTIPSDEFLHLDQVEVFGDLESEMSGIGSRIFQRLI